MSTVTVVDDVQSQTVIIPGAVGPQGAAGSLNLTPVTKSTTYAIQSTDNLIFANAASAAFTLTLPTAVGFKSMITIIATTINTNIVTLNTTSGQTIAGASSITLGTAASGATFKTISLVSDGSNWWIS